MYSNADSETEMKLTCAVVELSCGGDTEVDTWGPWNGDNELNKTEVEQPQTKGGHAISGNRFETRRMGRLWRNIEFGRVVCMGLPWVP